MKYIMDLDQLENKSSLLRIELQCINAKKQELINRSNKILIQIHELQKMCPHPRQKGICKYCGSQI